MSEIEHLTALLHRLEAWEEAWDTIPIERKYERGCPEYVDERWNIKIHDCYEHAGVSEWIDCLKFVLEVLKH